MKSQKSLERIKKQTKKLIDKIPAEKLDRAIICLEFMGQSTIEEARMFSEYSKRDDVTLDMMVEWVKNKKAVHLVEVAI